jgi:hypothetical protein
MKNKYILITLLLGVFFIQLGAFLKITHKLLFEYSGSTFLSIGLSIELTAVILLIIKLYKSKKVKQLLNL